MLSRLFRRSSCPIPVSGERAPRLRGRDLLPLAGFVLPTVVIGYGFVIPRSPIAGINDLTIGFGMTILGACITYVVGVRAARRG